MHVHPVESFVIQQVKDEPVTAEFAHDFPDSQAFMQRILGSLPVAYTSCKSEHTLPYNDPEPYSDTTRTQLQQLTIAHGRSFEIVDATLPHVWHDLHGNPYTSLNTKGNAFYSAKVIQTPTAPDGVIAFGLQESSVIRRVLRVSKLLRQAGIGTEYICGLAEPQLFGIPVHEETIDHHRMVPLGEYKQHIVHNYWQALPEHKKTPEELLRLHKAFGEMTFLVSLRAMDTSHRMKELFMNPSCLPKLYDFANTHLLPEGQQPFRTDNPADQLRFLQVITLPRLAINLAKLHAELLLTHTYPTETNITALGSIVDLDSVKGETLEFENDAPVDATAINNDIYTVIWAIRNTIDGDVLHQRYIEDITSVYHERNLFLKAYAAAYAAVATDRSVPLQDILTHEPKYVQAMTSPDDIHKRLDISGVCSWVEKQLPELQKSVENFLEHSPTLNIFANLMIEEFLEDITNGTYSLPLDAYYAQTNDEVTWQMFSVQYVYDEVLEYILGIYCEQAKLTEKEKSDYVHEVLHTSNDCRETVWQQLKMYLDVHKESLRQRYVLKPHTSVLSEHVPKKAYAIGKGFGMEVIHEKAAVDSQDTYKAFMRRLDDISCVTVGDYEEIVTLARIHVEDAVFSNTHPEGFIEEVITDGNCDSLDIYREDDEHKVYIDIQAISPDASYVTAVERLPGNKLAVHILFVDRPPQQDATQYERITYTNKKDIVNALRKLTKIQPRQLVLF